MIAALTAFLQEIVEMEHEKVPRLMVIISKLAGVVFRHVVFWRCIATI